MAKKEKPVTRTGLMTRAQTAIGNALDAVSIDADRRVEAIVGEAFEDMVWHALGFVRDSYHDRSWKLDICNGRDQDSLAGKAIREEVGKAVGRKIKAVLAAIPKTIPPDMIADLKRKWLEWYRREAESRVMEQAKATARAEVDVAFRREIAKHGL